MCVWEFLYFSKKSVFIVLPLLVKKLEQLKRLNKKFMKLRLRIAQYQITLLHTQRILPYLLRDPQTAC